MARFEVEGIDDLLKGLSSIDIERIAPKMLEESVPIVETILKQKSAAHHRSGDMEKSIQKTKAKRDANGYSILVRPTGKDGKGARNMEKMMYLEYGTSKQKATPVLTPAVREAEPLVCKKMEEVFQREVGAL